VRCQSYGMAMRYLGMSREGEYYFECDQHGCERQSLPMRSWWESGTSFQEEEVF
jgi:hypothetical protein